MHFSSPFSRGRTGTKWFSSPRLQTNEIAWGPQRQQAEPWQFPREGALPFVRPTSFFDNPADQSSPSIFRLGSCFETALGERQKRKLGWRICGARRCPHFRSKMSKSPRSPILNLPVMLGGLPEPGSRRAKFGLFDFIIELYGAQVTVEFQHLRISYGCSLSGTRKETYPHFNARKHIIHDWRVGRAGGGLVQIDFRLRRTA
jgi:hypothetical protein